MDELDRRFILIMKKLLRVMKSNDSDDSKAKMMMRNGNNNNGIKYNVNNEGEYDENMKKEWIDEVEEIMVNMNLIKLAYDSIISEIKDISEDTTQQQSSSSSSSTDELSLTSGVEAIKKELIIRDKIIRSLKQDIESEVMRRMGVDDSDTVDNIHNKNNSMVNINNYEAMIETYCFVIETKPYIEE